MGGTVLAGGAAGAFKDLQDEVQELQTFLNQTTESVVDVTVGQNITAAQWNTLMLAVQDCWDGRFGHVPSSSVTDGSATRVTSWTNSVTNEVSWTFASEADCRAFFNAGGRVGVSASRTGGTATTQNTRWTETLNAIGDVLVRYNTTEADDGTNNGIGFYELTTSNQTLLTKFTTTAPYTSDVITIAARVNSTTNPTVVTFVVTLTDAGDNAIDAPVDGTLTINARRRQPNVAGTGFTFPAPTDGVGAITGS